MAQELVIEGPIGDAWLDGVTSAQVREKLKDAARGQELRVYINSPGGSVSEGFAIYNILKGTGARLTTIVDGAAWSIASLIALAGDKVIVKKPGSIMIHDAWAVTIGDAEEHLHSAAALDKLSSTMADVYAAKMKKTQEEVRELMKAETWFTPEEAVSAGYADAMDEGWKEPAASAGRWREYARRFGFRHYEAFAARHGGAAAAGKLPDPPNDKQEATMSEATIIPKPAAQPQGNESQPQPQAQPQERAVADPPSPEIARLDQLADRLSGYLAKLEQRQTLGPLPSAGLSTEDDTLERHLRGKNAKERKEFLVTNWNDLKRAFPLRLDPQAANTYSTNPTGALVPAVVSSTALTVLQNRLAVLQSFARNVQAGRIGRNTVQVPIATTYGTTQADPTNFENVGVAAATISNRPVTPAHIATLLHMDYGELENGYQLAWITEIKAAEFADAIIQRVNTVLTPTNFTGQSNYAKTFASWSASDLKVLWARLSKALQRNIILHPEYYRVHLPDNLESFNPLQGNTMPGWDGFFVQTFWTGAHNEVAGFACNPQAIVIAAGLPAELPNVANRPTSYLMTVEKIGIQVEVYEWFSTASRTQWMSFDCMFGAGLGDASAGIIIRNAAS